MVNPEDLEYIKETVERDGLYYTMALDDTLDDIEDGKLQKLRKMYVDAAKALIKYCKLPEET